MSALAPNDALDWTRSLLQGRLLAEIFADRMENFVLKGGMAMRVRHEHARSTQDIDLDSSQDLPLYALQRLVRHAIHRAIPSNLLKNIEIDEPKQTETTARWNIRGFDPISNQNLTLTVEISRRDLMDANDFDAIPFAPNYTYKERPIQVYNNSSLAFKKIKALLSESREAPRDISDLYLLICAKVDPPIAKLREWLKDGQDSAIVQLWNKLDAMDEKRFCAEVLPALPSGEASASLYKNWDHIRIEVGTHLEEWIKLAQGEDKEKLEGTNNDCCPPPLSASTIITKHTALQSPISSHPTSI